MQSIMRWSWQKHKMNRETITAPNTIIKCESLKLLNDPPLDWSKHCTHPVLAIVGDGNTMLDDVREFESWGIPHDIYSVNRSMSYFERQIDHWCAIDSEESAWFMENVNSKVTPNKEILRHTIGYFPGAYDVWWEQDYPFTDEIQRRIWIGNSGYFALLTAIHMGYERIVLLGMPLNHEPHWYERPDEPPPMWAGKAFTQWVDFKIKRPEEAEKVRAMPAENSYSAFILGAATREWANV